jgi:hypothetical protein
MQIPGCKVETFDYVASMVLRDHKQASNLFAQADINE